MKAMDAQLTKLKGFSLVELLIVLAIISIIAAITLPSYQRYIHKAERFKAQTDLYKLQIWLEQQYTINATYPIALNCTECQLSELYDFSLQIEEDRISYLLTATPKINTVQYKDTCFTQSLNHLSVQGNQDMEGNSITGKQCWK